MTAKEGTEHFHWMYAEKNASEDDQMSYSHRPLDAVPLGNIWSELVLGPED